jgi:hypothetical protein
VWHNIQEKIGVQRERKVPWNLNMSMKLRNRHHSGAKSKSGMGSIIWHITAALSLLLFPTMLLPPAPFPKPQKTSLHLQS